MFSFNESKYKISIVIVNYKTPELVKRCINSVKINSYQHFDLIVVDNEINLNCALNLRDEFPDITLVVNLTNLGFGRANNQGIMHSCSEFVLLLNSDIIVLGDTIKECLEKFEGNPDLGVLGCKLLNKDGTHQKSTYSVASFRKLLDQNIVVNKIWPMQEEPIEAVMGSFMLIPRKVFDEVDGFDPDFFMYSEELDLCHRISKAGYRIEYFEGASAVHINGGSTTDKKWAMKQRYLSNALLFLKVRGYSGYVLYHLLFMFNTVTNFFAMWLLDKTWRKSYWKEQRYYFSNFGHYISIPFLYARKPGSGKRMLKRSQKHPIS